jgi:CDP-glucose 4,6-dehydratase
MGRRSSMDEERVMSSSWSGRNVFVTGATGLLGPWLVDELLRRGAEVTCLVRDWVPASRFVALGLPEHANIARGELEDAGLLLRILNEYEIDSVFHLGAQTIVGTAARSATSTFEANIRGTWNLLEACRALPRLIQRVVVASSDKAYGPQERLPYTEDMPLQGRSPYDVSKSCADLIAMAYHHTYGVPVAITRCGNLYGAGDLNYNRLVPGTIRSALRGERPIIRSDGLFIRDYFYIKDAVDAYLCLAENMPEQRCMGQAFNFGTETPVTVLDVVNLILRLCRSDLAPVILDQAANEIRAQYLDCSKARRVLSWSPAYSLEAGLCETVDWYRSRSAELKW